MATAQGAISRKAAQSKNRRRAYRRVEREVRAEIERQARLPEPPPATEIRTVLELNEDFADRVPPLRTIQAIARAASVIDESEPWRFEDGLGVSASLILDVLAEVVERTDGRRRHLTRGEVAWVVRIRRARPDLQPWTAYLLARELMSGKGGEKAKMFLAFAPWRSDLARARYEEAIASGWVDPPPVWLHQGKAASVQARPTTAATGTVFNLGGDVRTGRKSARKGKTT